MASLIYLEKHIRSNKIHVLSERREFSFGTVSGLRFQPGFLLKVCHERVQEHPVSIYMNTKIKVAILQVHDGKFLISSVENGF